MILQSLSLFLNFFLRSNFLLYVSSTKNCQIKVFKSYGHVSNFICKVLFFTTLNTVKEKSIWDKNLFLHQCQNWHIPISQLKLYLDWYLEISHTQEILILICALWKSMWWNNFQSQLSCKRLEYFFTAKDWACQL